MNRPQMRAWAKKKSTFSDCPRAWLQQIASSPYIIQSSATLIINLPHEACVCLTLRLHRHLPTDRTCEFDHKLSIPRRNPVQ